MKTKQLALDALKLLDKTLQFADWENGDGEKIGEQLCKAVAALEADIAQAVEPVDCQFQGGDGKWYGFINDKHKEDTIACGTWPIRYLYTTPPEPAVNADLLEALKRLVATDDAHTTVHATDGDDIARMIEYAEAFHNARAAIAKATS